MRQFLIDHYKKKNISRVRRLDYVVDTFFKVCKEEGSQNDFKAKMENSTRNKKLERGATSNELLKNRSDSAILIP